MAQVSGFDPAGSGQQPQDGGGNPIPVGVWGDSDSGGGVFGSSGVLPSGSSIPIDVPAGVEGHGAAGPGVVGRSLTDNGMVGESQDSEGVLARSVGSSGLLGVTFSPTDDAHGVFGSSTAGGNGVTGFVGEATGVIGNSVRGVGVHGITGGTGYPGVYGQTFGDTDGLPAGPGVWGSSDTGYGVFGSSQVHDGVAGVVFQEGNGVVGEHDAHDPFGAGVLGIGGFTTGVRGVTYRDGAGPGVHGETHGVGAAEGVLGSSDLSAGVRGVGVTGDGTVGLTTGGGNGVTGVHFATTPGAGVSGISVLGNGVDALTFADMRRNPNVAAVRGQSANGLAGLFVGKVRVTGQLSKGGGGFTIDHPKDPKNQYLSHSFVESPDMLNVYSGNATTDKNGTAQVRLPAYFEALNGDFRYQLTVIGDFAQAVVAKEIKGNAFTIRTDRGRVKVSWQVTGVRRDAWAQANRIVPEQKKPREERGKYLHPELFGKKAVGIHPAPDPRFTELVPRELREWADGLPADTDLTGARLPNRLAAARRILEKKAESDRLRFEVQTDKRLETARRRLQSSAPADHAELDDQWRLLERRLAALRPKP